MDVFKRLNKNKLFAFIIQTVVPFLIPLIWEIEEVYIAKSIQWILVILLSISDLFLIYELNKQQEEKEERQFKNKISRKAYSDIYELNQRKRDYIVSKSYNSEFHMPQEFIPYNVHEYIGEICNSFKNVFAQIVDINKEYMSVSFIYRYKSTSKKQNTEDQKWKWIVGKEQTMQIQLNDYVEQKDTVYYTLINEKPTAVFYNDKQEMMKQNKYFMSARDERHNRVGSIFGVQLMFSNNAESFVEAIMIISTYGIRFIEKNDKGKIKQLQRLIIDDLLPNYQRLLETEMGIMYLRHISNR